MSYNSLSDVEELEKEIIWHVQKIVELLWTCVTSFLQQYSAGCS